MFTLLFLSSNKFLFTIIKLYALDLSWVKYFFLLIKVLIIKLFIILKSIIAINRRLLILTNVIKYRTYIVKLIYYCWTNILYFFDILFIKKFWSFSTFVQRSLLRALFFVEVFSFIVLLILISSKTNWLLVCQFRNINIYYRSKQFN